MYRQAPVDEAASRPTPSSGSITDVIGSVLKIPAAGDLGSHAAQSSQGVPLGIRRFAKVSTFRRKLIPNPW